MTDFINLLTAAASLVAAIAGLVAAMRVGHVKELINSRMDQLLSSETIKSRAEGVLEGKASREK